jgi:hypothetical protein
MTASEGLNYGIVFPNWVVEGDTEELVAYGVAAEQAGWDGVFLADHLIYPGLGPEEKLDSSEYKGFPDPWITAAGIASRTEEIRLISWVTPVPRRQPWQLARNLATLDQLSNGRVMLGTGLGTPSDYTRFGKSWEPSQLGDRYDEALAVIEGLWSGEPFSYNGAFFSLDHAVLKPTPVQEPRIPIIVGGVWPNKNPFHRGARWDGMVPHYRGDGIVPQDGATYAPPRDDDTTHDEEVQTMVEYYHSIVDESGELFLPADPQDRGSDWSSQCKQLGASWVYFRPKRESGEWYLDEQYIRQGPPA